MTIYVIIFALMVFMAIADILKLISRDWYRHIYWCLVTILIMFKGLRWDTGTDWTQYYMCFERSSWSNIFSYARYGTGTKLMEPGYMFLNTLVKTFFPHYTFFLLFTNAFILISYGKVILKFIPRYSITVLTLASVCLELFPVRQSLTFAILCYSFQYILSGEWKKYVFAVVVCCLIHRSSVVFIIFYPILKCEFNIYRNIVIYLIFIVGTQIFGVIFDFLHNINVINVMTGGIMDTYDMTSSTMIRMDEESSPRNYILSRVSSMVQLSFFAYIYTKMKAKRYRFNPFFQLSLNAFFIVLCLNLIGQTPGFGSIYRLSNSLAISYALCVGFAIYYFIKTKAPIIAIFVFLLTFCIKLNTVPIMRPESNRYRLFVPYKSFFQEDEMVRSGRRW